MKPPMVNRDGGEWRLCWSRDGAGVYHTWVERYPEISCESADWRSARDGLIERIDRELHAGEWSADWHPPEPVTDDDRIRTDAEYVHLVPDGRYVPANELSTLYTEGSCETCGYARGHRTRLSMTLKIETAGGMCMSFLVGGYPMIFQKRLVDLLGPVRLGGAEVRQLTRIGPGRIEYVELNPESVIDSVTMKEPREIIGRECVTCGTKLFSHRFLRNEYRNLYPSSRIIKGRESFWAGRHYTSGLCVRLDWWALHRHKPECKGVLGQPLFVVRDDEVDANLKLQNIERRHGQSDAESRRHKARIAFAKHAGKIDPSICSWFMNEQHPSN
jgi:hypothetical protein